MKIYLDPGHGGNDPGAVANGMRESEIVLDVCLRLRPILQSAGINVRMSRTTDVFVGITRRWEDANIWGADLFVSVHANAGGGTGVETLIPTASPNNRNRDLVENRRFAEIVSNTLANTFGMRVRRSNGVMLETETRFDFVGVLRNTRMIAIMPEIAFIDSPLQNPDVEVLRNMRQEIAQALAEGVFKFLGISPETEDKIVPRFNTLAEMPDWARETIRKLSDPNGLGIIRGSGAVDSDGFPIDMNLTEDMIRMLVWNDRAGVYSGI